MKKITFLLFVWLNLIPAWGQLFSPKQIEEIQEFYLSYETHRKKAIENDEKVKPPQKLPLLITTHKSDRPNNFLPYFWIDNGAACITSNALRDTVKFNGKDVLIFDSPLLDFPEISEICLPNRIEPHEIGIFADKLVAYRGYTAQWSIENDSLFLIRVNPFHEGYFEGDSVAWEAMQPDIAELTGQRFINGKLFAGWVNGKIVGGTGGIYLRKELDELFLERYNNLSPERILKKQYTGHYIYPEEYSFWIKNGIVIQNDHLRKE